MGAIDTSFSSLMKQWRAHRKVSQLDLSVETGISQRHLSFLESGRSSPSREMIVKLSDGLNLPLRDRNQLLSAAGYAPLYRERALDDSEMDVVNNALRMSLKHHEPFPAIVADRNWDMVMSNRPADKLLSILGGEKDIWEKVDPSGNKNIYRLTFHPEGFSQLIENWSQLSSHLLNRLASEITSDPDNGVLKDLYIELSRALDFDNHYDEQAPIAPVMPMTMNLGGISMNLFSMISSFGTAQDVTAQELKVETFFPADSQTEIFFKHLASQS